mmetsp:Transcript_25707/g.61317  ORF Transcript_25707/g.61317 Transcript_25707/m.61317 type:complete len:268 (-) Transcript_25707:518-1321(-)
MQRLRRFHRRHRSPCKPFNSSWTRQRNTCRGSSKTQRGCIRIYQSSERNMQRRLCSCSRRSPDCDKSFSRSGINSNPMWGHRPGFHLCRRPRRTRVPGWGIQSALKPSLEWKVWAIGWMSRGSRSFRCTTALSNSMKSSKASSISSIKKLDGERSSCEAVRSASTRNTRRESSDFWTSKRHSVNNVTRSCCASRRSWHRCIRPMVQMPRCSNSGRSRWPRHKSMQTWRCSTTPLRSRTDFRPKAGSTKPRSSRQSSRKSARSTRSPP